MRTPIITESMKRLRLDPQAPFPHQLESEELAAKDLRDKIKLAPVTGTQGDQE